MRLSTFAFPIVLAAACATNNPPAELTWDDDDRRPVEKPSERYSGNVWDAADQTVFRPITRTLLLEEVGPAQNVNALGEVPNSSWYTNRMALEALSPERVVQGPCVRSIDATSTWTVTRGKFGGFNPGFTIEDTSDGRRYLLKFDRSQQRERPTAADVIGSKVYWAAGYFVPCNEIVYFDPGRLQIDAGAKKANNAGGEAPLEWADVEEAMRAAPRRYGKVRAAASLYLDGEPLGPFPYQGTRSDDPNDVIPHEDRRELRGSRIFAAWINHFDAREANTLDMFVRADGAERGFVRHHILDFGDCLGSQWEYDEMSRRLGYAHYFDPDQAFIDFVSLGAVVRPWERIELHPVFGYFDAANFDPVAWKPGYPNPAFARMDDEDAYWGARTLSRFTDEHIDALVEAGEFTSAEDEAYLARTLRIRRDKIVNEYLRRVTPLDEPRFVRSAEALCVDDLLVRGGWARLEESEYHVDLGRGWSGVAPDSPTICVPLGEVSSARAEIRMTVRRHDQETAATPVTFTIERDGAQWQLVGVRRR